MQPNEFLQYARDRYEVIIDRTKPRLRSLAITEVELYIELALEYFSRSPHVTAKVTTTEHVVNQVVLKTTSLAIDSARRDRNTENVELGVDGDYGDLATEDILANKYHKQEISRRNLEYGDPFEISAVHEFLETLRRFIDDEEDWNMLVLVSRGESPAEIALRYGIDRDTVYKRVQRARKQAKRAATLKYDAEDLISIIHLLNQ
ncbi:MAG: sigma-70 family RNA polymerase sigma factor [Anaerolineae bacterium]|nr:sigma-70 family RNA polymerase sigma factor [Anaerolineae bacterium]